MNTNHISVRIRGDFACFSRPEMKVERVSYPLATPSAARGILEAIFWKPEMFYLIDSIRVVRKGTWINFQRKEVVKGINFNQARSVMEGGGGISAIQAGGGTSDTTLRNMLALQNVEYIITAEIRVSEIGKSRENNTAKYVAEANRRIKSGKCFHRPCLGMREFAADFEPVAVADDFEPENKWNEDLGLMLYDVFPHRKRAKGFRFPARGEENAERRSVLADKDAERSGSISRREFAGSSPVKPAASFFRAKIEDSVMDCHPERVRII